jgi:hypothetical protein
MPNDDENALEEVHDIAIRMGEAITDAMGEEKVSWAALMGGMSVLVGGLLADTDEPGARSWCEMMLAARAEIVRQNPGRQERHKRRPPH